MCYSAESSAKTTLYSLITIIVLFNSGIPHFKWLGVVLIGWCSMQFAEFLLWLTNPRKGCTPANKIITMTLIPFILCIQGVAPIVGSLFVKPWSQCSQNRRLFMVGWSICSVLLMLNYFYGSPIKYCTTVTPQGHLDWFLSEWKSSNFDFGFGFGIPRLFATTIWLIIITFPFIWLWDVSYKAVIAFNIIPLFGYFYGFTTDSNGSIWCHYTSFTSIVSLIMYGLYKFNIYNVLK
jgi:hypothetical protein